MKALRFVKKVMFGIIILQIGVFIFIKQRYSEMERKNQKLEDEIAKIINANNMLKIKLTTVQNQYRVRQLVTRYASEFKPIKPSQVIEKENI
jgi:hypothetical protein